MSDQIILAWTVDVANSSFGPAAAAAALSAVDLYENDTTDPVLGQMFGLTVATDVTTNDATSATRTLTLNMTEANSPTAPPPFPCHPRTSTPPELPYPLRATKTLPGSFFVENGLMTVDVTDTQIPSLSIGDDIQFLKQQGVVYTVTAVGSTSISITPAYSGTTANTGAFKEVIAPCPLDRAAIYSSSDFDTGGVEETVPEIPQGPGARTVLLTYLDSTGDGPFTTEAFLTGKRPALFNPGESSGTDIAKIVNIEIVSVGGFGNNIGELTFVELSDALPDIPPNTLIGTGIGSIEGSAPAINAKPTFKDLTDEAQLLIGRHLAYQPPSFFALAQQQTATPLLEGDFLVTTGSKDVPTIEDQSGVVSQGDFIEFALQPGTLYEVAAVTPRAIQLVTIFLGIDTNNTGLNNTPMNNSAQTKGNIGTSVIRKPTGARDVSLSGAPPSNDELSVPLGQFVALEVAAPPPKPPLSPATVPAPTFLSGLFTRTLQLALAGVPITSATVTFA